MVTFTLDGKTYSLATNMRVAYEIQNCNNHTSYKDVFSRIGDMTIEEQIQIVYCAYSVANKNADIKLSEKQFLHTYLDDVDQNLNSLMTTIKAIVSGIMGKSLDETGEEGN